MDRILIVAFLIFTLMGFAQEKKKEIKIEQPEKQRIRQGNDFYKQNNFVDAEVQYKKAIEENPNYEKANYNLGNAIYEQNRFKEATPMYDLVSKTTDNVLTRAESFHNMGNSMMKEKQYDKAIEAYKNSLRNNSIDDETRYNLALAQKMLKDQQDQNKDNKDKDKKEDNKDQNKKDQDKKEDQNKDQDKDKEGDNKDDNKNKEQEGDKDKQEQQPKPQQNKLTPQQVEQLLEAMNKEENKTQKKVNAKKAQGRKVKQEKDW